MTREEFPLKVRKAAWERAGGACECGCGQPFGKHPKSWPHYDHIIPAKLGGPATLANCRVVRIDCHQTKTVREDMPRIVKVRREDKRRAGLEALKRKLPGSKDSPWKAKVGGGWERREK